MNLLRFLFVIVLTVQSVSTLAAPPAGYLVYSSGKAGDASSRKIVRLTMPKMNEKITLTNGEDISPQISPDGKWVAYAKAKLAGGSDYHSFHLWRIYLVSIHGAAEGREEIKIDDGYWPSWGNDHSLYYNQVDGTHSKIIKVKLDDDGGILKKETFFSTNDLYSDISEVNECFVSPDESWFAARTRGTINGVWGYLFETKSQVLIGDTPQNTGCMPAVAPNGKWAILAGSDQGIRWGDAPNIENRKENQLLIEAESGAHAYHPGISSDGKWVMASFGTDNDHNAGQYNLYLYPLDESTMSVGEKVAISTEEFNGWPDYWVGAPSDPPQPKPTITTFYPESYTLIKGESTKLIWETKNADQVSLNDQDIASSGKQDVNPSETTSYILKASDQNQNTEAELTIKVNDTAQAVAILSFSASPQTIKEGDETTLSWEIDNATQIYLDEKRVSPVGNITIALSQKTNFTLRAEGHQGPVEKTIIIEVEDVKTGPDLYSDRGGFSCRVEKNNPSWQELATIFLFGLFLFIRLKKKSK